MRHLIFTWYIYLVCQKRHQQSQPLQKRFPKKFLAILPWWSTAVCVEHDCMCGARFLARISWGLEKLFLISFTRHKSKQQNTAMFRLEAQYFPTHKTILQLKPSDDLSIWFWSKTVRGTVVYVISKTPAYMQWNSWIPQSPPTFIRHKIHPKKCFRFFCEARPYAWSTVPYARFLEHGGMWAISGARWYVWYFMGQTVDPSQTIKR